MTAADAPITPCPDCGEESSEDYGGEGLCWTCFDRRSGNAAPEPGSNGNAAPAAAVQFLTVAELRQRTPSRPTWLWDGYLAAGDITLLAGKPKVGKSTIALAVSTAIATGSAAFLGREVMAGAVVYVSEEGGPTLLHKLPPDDAALHVLTRDNAWPKPGWSSLVNAAVAHAQTVGARLLVIDTAAFWSALPAEREKDAGAVTAVMSPLTQATRSGLAVLLVTHARKAGGEDGDAIRGSSAWAASADTILELERGGENAPPTQRLLLALSRHPAAPACALVDHDPSTGSWAISGHADDRRSARVATMRTLVLDALPAGDSAKRSEIEEATGTAWRDLLDTVNALVAEGHVKRTGKGQKGDPYRYAKAVGDAVPQNPTAPTESPGGRAGLSVVCPVGTPQNPAPPTAIDAVGPEPHSNGSDEEERFFDELRREFDATEVDHVPDNAIVVDIGWGDAA